MNRQLGKAGKNGRHELGLGQKQLKQCSSHRRGAVITKTKPWRWFRHWADRGHEAKADNSFSTPASPTALIYLDTREPVHIRVAWTLGQKSGFAGGSPHSHQNTHSGARPAEKPAGSSGENLLGGQSGAREGRQARPLS